MHPGILIEKYGLTEAQAEYAVKLVPAVRRALKANKIYIRKNYISKSSMTTNLSLYIIYKQEITCLDWAFGKSSGTGSTLMIVSPYMVTG